MEEHWLKNTSLYEWVVWLNQNEELFGGQSSYS